ncbi:hypothetical protein V1264_001090 [Littorina saxatilis]|uniref:RNA helicase n=1 Tax=Littorina saxatilis TaxID=31220 RepID=A0AAN9C0D1_9CAEN
MMESLLKIDLLEVKNPSEFTAKVVLPEEKDVYEKAWQDWQCEMQALEKKRIINDNIHINEVCAVKDDQDKNWHRVRVEKIFYSLRGERVSCYFVDSGQRKDFLRARLFNLPEKYQCARVHPQVRSLKLGGLQPMSLQIEATDNGLRVPNRPTNKWDDSAVNHFDSLTKECDGAGVRVMGQDEKGNLQVCLYLRKNAQLINVNELLIEEEYACSTSAGASSDSDSSGCSRQARGTAPQRPASDQKRKDGMVNDEVNMSEERLKEVMAKVQRVIAKSKNHSDTEATPRGHGGPKLGSRPPLGSQAASRNGGLVSPGGDGDVPEGSVTSPTPGLEGASNTLSPAGDGPVLLSDTGLRGVASPPRLSKPSPSGSNNSGATQSHNGHENTSTQYSAVPKFRCADSSPKLIAELMGVTSPCTLRQPVTAPTRQEAVLGSGLKTSPILSSPGQGHSQGQVPHQGQGSSPLTPASLAKSTSAAGVSLPTPGATPSGTGRGRGLRKLYSDDITKATPSVNPPALPGKAVSRPPATDMGAKPKLKCPSNDLKNSNPLQDSISPAAASLKGGAENIKSLSNDLQNSKPSKGGISPGATAAALNVVGAGNPLPKDKVARLKEFHAKRQKGKRGSSSDGTVSDTGLVNGLTGAQGAGPSYLDGNSSDSDMFGVQERKRVSFSDMQSLRQNKVLKEDAASNAGASAGERSSDSGSDGAKVLSEGESLAYYSRKKFRGKAAGQR